MRVNGLQNEKMMVLIGDPKVRQALAYTHLKKLGGRTLRPSTGQKSPADGSS